jgi:UDPglucose 6-dehydrogenase
VAVVGLGRLGAPLAACLASRGFEVIGADLDPDRVARVGARRAPIAEPGLDELLSRCGDRIRATTEIGRAASESECTFLVVPTPSEPDGRFSNRHLLAACAEVGAALRDCAGHLVVVTSTVMPGSTGGELRAALEQASGRRCGDGFGLCYSPEFVALGSVIRDLFRPDFVLIGESDPDAGDRLQSVYARLCEGAPPVRRMSFVNAELTKLALNGFVTTRISYANALAELCERIPGADVDVISGALGLDHRIGTAYLRGGPAYGGPCFPRDNRAVGALARELSVAPLLAEATDATNRRQGERLLDLVLALRGGAGTVAVVGLAYKPGTDVVEDAPGLLLARGLLDRGVRVRLFDPAALEPARRALGGRGEYATSLGDCCRGAGVVALVAPDSDASELVAALRAPAATRPVVIDCWRALDPALLEGVARHVPLGRSPAGAAPALPAAAAGRPR